MFYNDGMKRIALCLAVFLAAPAAVSLRTFAEDVSVQKPRSVEMREDTNKLHVLAADIAADRDKIIQEEKAIRAGCKDVEIRKAAIAALKKEISDKKNQRGDILYGREKKGPKRRTRIK